MDRLSVTPAFSLEPDFFDAIYDLRDQNPSVLVIDNIATLFRDGLMGATSQGRLTFPLYQLTPRACGHGRGDGRSGCAHLPEWHAHYCKKRSPIQPLIRSSRTRPPPVGSTTNARRSLRPRPSRPWVFHTRSQVTSRSYSRTLPRSSVSSMQASANARRSLVSES